MNVMIVLPPEIESRLRAAVLRCGLDVGAYATKLIVGHVPAASEVDAEGPTEDEGVRPLRGLIPIHTVREPLFTQELVANIDDLPKRKPRIHVIRRALSEADDA